MQLPEELQAGIDSIVQSASPSALRKAREEMTRTYKEGRDSGSIFNDEGKRLAYLGARMPSTYGAVYKVLQNISSSCSHFLDLGAGPGTASWAAAELLPGLEKITLIERSQDAIAMGRILSQFSNKPALREGGWIQQSLTQESAFPKADLGVLSYVLNELKDPESLIERCWESVPLLVLIEPGTPKGFQLIRKMRQKLIGLGAFIAAPCPHRLECPSNWCHFSVRIERSRLQRFLKEGALGYEDEKFSYLIASKKSGAAEPSRIIRHPLKGSGHVRLSLCKSDGTLEERVVTRKEKELYRNARDAEWGDSWV